MRIWDHHQGWEGRRHTHPPAAAQPPAPSSQNNVSSSPAPTAAGSTAPAGRAAVAASQSTTSQLSLTTAEGDKVVLSFSTSSGAAAATDGSSGTGDYASLRTRQTQVNIQVNGDLNPQELQDIQKLAKLVSGAAGNLLNGNTDQAAQQVAQAQKLDSIQNFAFSLSSRVDYQFDYQPVGSQPQQTLPPVSQDPAPAAAPAAVA